VTTEVQVRPKVRASVRAFGRVMVAIGPLIWSVAAMYSLVRLSWWRCTGGYVSRAYNFTFLLWLVGTPALAYACTGILRLTARRRRTMKWRSACAVVGSLVATAVFSFFTVRYYHLTQMQCMDGLPTWWPSWLPAYG
jgi:hypothetical protein